MKKILTTIAIAALCATAAQAQYGITKETYDIPVKKFPTYYIQPEQRTYCIKIDNKLSNTYNNTYFTADIDLPGWTEIQQDSLAYIKIDMEIQPLKVIKIDLKDNKTEKMTPDGLQINHNYFPTLKYIFNIKCTIKSPEETIERRSNPDGTSIEKQHPIKQSFKTPEEARKHVNDNIETYTKKIIATTSEYMTGEINKALSERYYPTKTTEEITLGYLLDEGNPFQQDMAEAQRQIRETLSQIQPEKECKDIAATLNPWIEKFRYAAGELSNKEPAQRKAKEEILRDIATIYLIAEDFEQCKYYSQILRDTFKNKDGEKYLKTIKNTQADFARHHQTSRHFEEY